MTQEEVAKEILSLRVKIRESYNRLSELRKICEHPGYTETVQKETGLVNKQCTICGHYL